MNLKAFQSKLNAQNEQHQQDLMRMQQEWSDRFNALLNASNNSNNLNSTPTNLTNNNNSSISNTPNPTPALGSSTVNKVKTPEEKSQERAVARLCFRAYLTTTTFHFQKFYENLHSELVCNN